VTELPIHDREPNQVPRASLDSFPGEFREGMAARAARLHNTGESAPSNWEPPFGSPDVHMALTAMAPDSDRLDMLMRRSADLSEQVAGVQMIYQLDCKSSDGRAFGFRDNISQPAIDGSGLPGTNSTEQPIKAGEFILGYPDETGRIPPMPSPHALGRNGSFLVVRKLEQRVAASARICTPVRSLLPTRDFSPRRSWDGGAAVRR